MRIAYRNYLLALLMVILACNYVDRMALGIVLQDIKIDLQLTDTQLGLLSGIAFSRAGTRSAITAISDRRG